MAKPKEKVVSKPKSTVTMLEYSIKMVIPTGAYANIQPEIKVKAGSPEEALEYIAPHMNKMWKEYFMVNEKRVEYVTPPACPVVPYTATIPNTAGTGTSTANPEIVTNTPETTSVVQEPSPVSSVSVIKATQAIESCQSLEALELIKNQIELSTKIEKEEKPKLRGMIVERFNELNADEFIKRNA